MKYLKELDSLRALAILSVILGHWAPGFFNRIPWGGFGVNLFFVLSGFLITRILIESKIRAGSKNISSLAVVKNFYFRRSLRIFPIYYLTILIVFIFNKYFNVDFHESLIFYITYTPNFYFFKTNSWMGLSHLWSLAVEEQFYLIWPWIIIFTKKKYLKHVIVGFILAGMVSEYIFGLIPMGTLLPNSCFDGFGLGALLAWYIVFEEDLLVKYLKVIHVVGITATVLLILVLIYPGLQVFLPQRILNFLSATWLLTYVVFYAENGKLKFNFLFGNKVLIFLGKISYGMYLYHFIIPSLLNTVLINKYLNPLLPDLLYVKYFGFLFFLENFILVTLISWLSYRFIEMPFLRLKKHFNS